MEPYDIYAILLVALFVVMLAWIIHTYLSRKVDGIITIFDGPNGYSISFILCIPFDEFLNKKHCKMEIKMVSDPTLYQELSQENHSP